MEEAPKIKKGQSIVAFAFGAALASIVTLLTAPASGKMTRKRVVSKARQTQRKALREVGKFERSAERKVKQIKRDTTRQVKRTSKDLAKRAHNVRHAAEVGLEHAREKVLHSSNGHTNGQRKRI